MNNEICVYAFTSPTTLQMIKMNTEKIIYINSTQESLPIGKKVMRRMPYNHKIYNLFELTLPLQSYNNPSGQLLEILNSSETKGIYEDEVPLIYRYIVRLGCLARVTKQRKQMDSSNML